MEFSGEVLGNLRDEEFIIRRARRSGDGHPVLLQTVGTGAPVDSSVALFKNSVALQSDLDSSWAVRPVEVVEYRGRPTLVMEDPGGEFLDTLIGRRIFIPDFLRLAVGIASAMDGLHRRDLVHKDVKPQNLIVNTVTGEVRLTGFGLTSRLPRHRQPPEPPEVIAGTLAYMAPEQTGRMNRSIDSRSDLYSVGVTFYEMLVGDGSHEIFNKQWHDYTGIAAPDAVDGQWIAAFHPDDLAIVVKTWKHIRETGESSEVEARMRRFDGVYRWFLLRASPFRDEEGNIVKWYGTNSDIDDFKQAEGLLAGEKCLFEMIATGHSLPAILDALCRIVEELSGGSPTSILLLDKEGKHLRSGAAPNLPASYTKAVDGIAIGPSAGSCGTAAYRKEKVLVSDIANDPLWADYRAVALENGLRACWSTPIMSSNGAVLGTIAMYAHQPRQITSRENGIIEQFTHLASIAVERKRAEDALKKSEAFLAEGQRISHTGTWAWDLVTDQVIWSEEHCRIFGYSPDEVGGTFAAILDRMLPEDRVIAEKPIVEAVRMGKDYCVEYRITLPDGTVRYNQSVGRAIANDCGEVTEYIGTTSDITERKRAEEELRRSESDLRKAQAELAHVTRVTTMGELAASIAHEVNQPIAGVVLNGNACLRWLSRMDGDTANLADAREAVQRIIRDGARAGEVIARIRALFKKTDAAREALDINQVIRDVMILARGEMDKRRVALQSDLATGLPLVLGDRVQLQQVMLNLILNGIEAMSAVEGRPRELLVKTRVQTHAEVLVTVSDSGIGLDMLGIDQMFAAFHTTKPGGLGMGLSISRTIVEAHGGRLWATPNDGFGATFHFTLPQCAPRSPSEGGA